MKILRKLENEFRTSEFVSKSKLDLGLVVSIMLDYYKQIGKDYVFTTAELEEKSLSDATNEQCITSYSIALLVEEKFLSEKYTRDTSEEISDDEYDLDGLAKSRQAILLTKVPSDIDTYQLLSSDVYSWYKVGNEAYAKYKYDAYEVALEEIFNTIVKTKLNENRLLDAIEIQELIKDKGARTLKKRGK